MRALLRKDPDAQFRFWGGDSMREVAGEPVRHIRDLAIMGFVEVMLHLRTVLGNIRLCKQDILQYRPDAIVFIDYPGFNLRIAKFTHKHGFKNIHYISPQLWAWKKGRIKTILFTMLLVNTGNRPQKTTPSVPTRAPLLPFSPAVVNRS